MLAINPIQFFAAYQLEIFIIHQVMFRLIQRFYPVLYGYPKREFAVCLVLTTGLAILYRRYIHPVFSQLVDSVLSKAYRILAE